MTIKEKEILAKIIKAAWNRNDIALAALLLKMQLANAGELP